ncbi:MAG: vitamin K epoxide reductase family protein [Nanoarchaeota archaeon]
MNDLWIIALAFVGFVNSFYIYYKKQKHQQLVCIIGSHCNTVIRSKYATLFGIDNTLLGMAYYAFLIFIFLITSPFFGLYFLVGGVALVSLYLLYIQLVVLKEWCDYCLLAAFINLLLVVLLFFP